MEVWLITVFTLLKYIKNAYLHLSWSLDLLRLVLEIIEVVSFYARYFFASFPSLFNVTHPFFLSFFLSFFTFVFHAHLKHLCLVG